MPLTIPRTATFRRAEGLTFIIDLCKGTARLTVYAARQDGEKETSITLREAEILGRLYRWQTADELDVPHDVLVSLVERNCAFWSADRPTRNLTGDALRVEGKVALRRSVQAIALVTTSLGTGPFQHMPRRGSLDRASFGGVICASFEMETAVSWATMRCCTRHALVVRDIVPLLDGAHDLDTVAPTADARAYLHALGALGFLERHTRPVWDGAARVTWLGHAGVMYEASGKRILVDPVFHPASEPSRSKDRPADARNIGHVDAVLITHGDNDHMHPNSLLRLPRDTPIYVPSTPKVFAYQVDLCQVLWAAGCRRVIEVDEWQRIVLGDVTVVATPFRGEDWGLTLACRTYLIHGPDLTVFLNADSTSTPEVYAKLAAEFRIDMAFVGVTGAAETYAMPPGFGYGNFYTAAIPAERANEWVTLCNGPVESAEAARQLGARYAFGYAAGGPGYQVSYCDRGSHAELAALLLESGGKTKPLELRVDEPVRIPPE